MEEIQKTKADYSAPTATSSRFYNAVLSAAAVVPASTPEISRSSSHIHENVSREHQGQGDFTPSHENPVREDQVQGDFSFSNVNRPAAHVTDDDSGATVNRPFTRSQLKKATVPPASTFRPSRNPFNFRPPNFQANFQAMRAFCPLAMMEVSYFLILAMSRQFWSIPPRRPQPWVFTMLKKF